ncbi:MAG: LysR family transcriptional regulator [Clostridia bacterium]|nr:LysR family transcriptional regulator [Clostridia bacterium]
MDINRIEVLIKAIELGSLSKAANEYLYTPSAASHILDEIESEIGIRFIKRSYKGIEVEKGCEQIVEKLKQILELKKEMVELAQEKQNNTAITIATYASLSKHVLPGIIKEFNTKFPHVRVNVAVSDNMKDFCKNNKVDILFSEQQDSEYGLWEPLITDSYVAVMPETDKALDNINKDDLDNYTLVVVNDGKVCSYLNDSKNNNIINVDSHDDSTAIHMVKAGIGVAVLPKLSLDTEDINCAELSPKLTRVLGLTYRKDDYENKCLLREFIKCIKSTIKG